MNATQTQVSQERESFLFGFGLGAGLGVRANHEQVEAAWREASATLSPEDRQFYERDGFAAGHRWGIGFAASSINRFAGVR